MKLSIGNEEIKSLQLVLEVKPNKSLSNINLNGSYLENRNNILEHELDKYSENTHLKEVILAVVNQAIDNNVLNFTKKEWMNIKEGSEYAGVSVNTFKKYIEKGLKICEIEGIKRVSKTEIDKFLYNHSY